MAMLGAQQTSVQSPNSAHAFRSGIARAECCWRCSSTALSYQSPTPRRNVRKARSVTALLRKALSVLLETEEAYARVSREVGERRRV